MAGVITLGALFCGVFRHTFSVQLLKTSVDMRKLSKALGHSRVTITERYYAKWKRCNRTYWTAIQRGLGK